MALAPATVDDKRAAEIRAWIEKNKCSCRDCEEKTYLLDLLAASAEREAAMRQQWILVADLMPEVETQVLVVSMPQGEVQFAPTVAYWNGKVWHHESGRGS